MGAKEKKQIMVFIAGAMILIGIWVYKGMSRGKPVAIPSLGITTGNLSDILPAATSNVKAGQSAPAAVKSAPAGAITAKAIKYIGRENRDPLDNMALVPKAPEKPVTETSTKKAVVSFPAGTFTVSAIIWGSKRPQAIINDNVVGIGEKLGGGEIVNINKDGVHINYEGEEVLLSIK